MDRSHSKEWMWEWIIGIQINEQIIIEWMNQNRINEWMRKRITFYFMYVSFECMNEP